MTMKKLALGKYYRLPFSEITLSVLPKLRTKKRHYFQNDNYIPDALAPGKKYAQSYLNGTCMKVVQNEKNLSEFFLLEGFEILDVLDRYPPKYLVHQTINFLVCDMPHDSIIETLVEADLYRARLLDTLTRKAKITAHDLLRGLQAHANDNDEKLQKENSANHPPTAAVPLPKIDLLIHKKRKQSQVDLFSHLEAFRD